MPARRGLTPDWLLPSPLRAMAAAPVAGRNLEAVGSALEPQAPMPMPTPASARTRWPDRWRSLRDGLLASPVFRRRAAAFWLTRPVARRRAAEVFDLVAGFVYSQVLLACVRLDLFALLAEGPQAIAVLASRLGLSADAAHRLLDAAVALRLAERRGDDRYGLGPLGASLVGNAAVTAMVEHHAAFYADLADPVGLLRREGGAGELASYWPYAAESAAAAAAAAAASASGSGSGSGSKSRPASTTAPASSSSPAPAPAPASIIPAAAGPAPAAAAADATRAYTALMAASQPLVADEILDAYPLRRHRCLLDVGGGDGSFLAAAAARAPHLRLILFDLPAVADRARVRFAAAGLADRSSAVGGSFLHDPLPAGADLATLVRVVHDHDDASALALLRAVRRALAPGGRLLLAEPMAGTAGAERMGDAYFGFYLLAMGSGRPRTASRLAELLRAAGFSKVRRLATRQPLQTSLLVAEAEMTGFDVNVD